MAIQKPQGGQLDIQSIASDIAADPTAIGDIATGISSGSPVEFLLPSDIGSIVQAWEADLDAIASLIPSDGEVLIAEGSPLAWNARALTSAYLSDSSDIVTAAGYSADLSVGSPPNRTNIGSPSPSYTNSTGAPLMVLIRMIVDFSASVVEVDGFSISSFATASTGSPADTLEATHSVLVPDGSTYTLIGGGTILSWYEVQ